MSLPGSWLDDGASLVGDASVWINLAATGRADIILGASPARHLITSTARAELDAGRPKGRQAALIVAELIDRGLVAEVLLGPAEEDVFIGLVAGSVAQTLDDGEAATIAFALAAGAIALIDERKATGLCERHYPSLKVVTTTDLLLSDAVRSALGEINLADTLFKALTQARMRVPERHLAEICGLLGVERRQTCLSLPGRWREVTTPQVLASQDRS